jgi:hypothetical protein
MFNGIQEMELAVLDLKNAREKLSVKNFGTINHLDIEMENICSFMSKSGNIDLTRQPSQDGTNELFSLNSEKLALP